MKVYKRDNVIGVEFYTKNAKNGDTFLVEAYDMPHTELLCRRKNTPDNHSIIAAYTYREVIHLLNNGDWIEVPMSRQRMSETFAAEYEKDAHFYPENVLKFGAEIFLKKQTHTRKAQAAYLCFIDRCVMDFISCDIRRIS